MLKLKVFGKFQIVDKYGKECSPSGQKAKGLLILLACSPNQTRSRYWLQDKLWSDRSREQAAGSLRTCLNEIRKDFGDYHNILTADRVNVSLDTANFALDYDVQQDDRNPSQSVEAFENIDIKDREFEHAIRELRASLKARYSRNRFAENSTSSPIVDVTLTVRGGLLGEVVGEAMVNRITSTLNRANGITTIVRREETPQVSMPFTTCSLKIFETNGEVYVSSRVMRGSDRSEIWSSDLAIKGPPSDIIENIEFGRLSLQTIDKISDALIQYDLTPELGTTAVYSLEVRAIQCLFKLDKESLKESDRLLAMAYARSPQGHYLAWRAFLRNLAFFQHRTMDFLDNSHSTLELSYEAVRESPDHPVVLSIASQLDYIHQGDLGTSLAIADKAIQYSSPNPLSWAFYSNALVANKRYKEGVNAAEKAISLAKGSRHEFFFHHFACMASVSKNDYHKSMEHAQAALRFRPDFVSTRRYELAIAAEMNNSTVFDHSLNMMKRHEPGFDAHMLLESDYPVTTMRRLPLIESVNNYLNK